MSWGSGRSKPRNSLETEILEGRGDRVLEGEGAGCWKEEGAECWKG